MQFYDNLVFLTGRIGEDPTEKLLDGGSKVTNISLAINKKTVKNGIEYKRTDWPQVEAWGYFADVATRLHKGDLVRVLGEIKTGDYTKDGVKHYTTTVVVHELYKLDTSIYKNADGQTAEDVQNESQAPTSAGTDLPDDIPF